MFSTVMPYQEPDEPDEDDLPGTVVELLAAVRDVKLPSLTREELFALDDAPALIHAEDQRWWDSLDAAGQSLVVDTAQRGMIARNLIVADDELGLRLDRRVRVVLQARRDPSWLVVVREPELSEIRVVASGIDLTDGHTDAVLISARIEGVYANRLTSLSIALRSIAGWLTRGEAEAEAPIGRTIETLVPRDPARTSEIISSRAIVMGASGQWRLSEIGADGQPADAEVTDDERLRTWLLERVLKR